MCTHSHTVPPESCTGIGSRALRLRHHHTRTREAPCDLLAQLDQSQRLQAPQDAAALQYLLPQL